MSMESVYTCRNKLEIELKDAFLNYENSQKSNVLMLKDKVHQIAAAHFINFVKLCFQNNSSQSRCPPFIDEISTAIQSLSEKHKIKICLDYELLAIKSQQIAKSYSPKFGSLESFVSVLEERRDNISVISNKSTDHLKKYIPLISNAICLFEEEAKDIIFDLQDEKTAESYQSLRIVLKQLSNHLNTEFHVVLQMQTAEDETAAKILSILGENHLIKDICAWIRKNHQSDWKNFLPWLTKNYPPIFFKTDSTSALLTYLYYNQFLSK